MIQYLSACELAHHFPSEIAQFLELEHRVRGRRFREESVTDLLLAALAKLPGLPLELRTPPESTTGSDLDIILVDLAARTRVGYRIQAKRLSADKVNWDRNSYGELAHQKNTGSQYAELIKPTNLKTGTLTLTPLYAFYNPASICAKSGGAIAGIELCGASTVGDAIADILVKQASKGASQARQLRKLRHGFFPLSTLFCPPPPSGGGQRRPIATPSESAAQVAAALSRGLTTDGASRTGLPDATQMSDAEVRRYALLRNIQRDDPEPVADQAIDTVQIVLDATP